MPDTSIERPVPDPSSDSLPYWQGLRAHELRLQRCARCSTVRHYPRPLCERCYSFDCDWVVASGRGTIHSWTVAHHAFHPAFKTALPYVVVTVDLAEGVRMAAPLIGAASADPALGRAVTLAFDDIDGELSLPCFRLSKLDE